MENIIVIRSLKRWLDQAIIHEQAENGATINNNLNVDQIDQQFITPKRISQLDKRHSWIKERLVGHITPHAI
jgi:hypothetical protein